ncbi:MAG: sortase, partial [Aggregatilineales bacterium]
IGLAMFLTGLVGLVLVVGAMIQNIATLQQETASAQQRAEDEIRAAIPTIEPTPVLSLANIVLPSGHTPPTAAGGAQFNFAEIPESLRSMVTNQVYLPEIERPPTTPESARRIIIPDIGVDQVIVQGTDWEALKKGVGQVLNGITPGDEGNLVLAAHNDIYGEIFRYLPDLEPGMRFEIHTERQIYTYIIRDKQIVEPDAVHVMDYQGFAGATLISCYPYQVSTDRVVITAERIDL